MSKKFNKLNLSPHWQQYFSKYPDGYTIIENLIDWVSQVNKMVDSYNELTEHVDNFKGAVNNTTDGFRDELDTFLRQFDDNLALSVITTLSEWENSGFLDIVINEALNTKYHEMDNRLTTQMEQTKYQARNTLQPTEKTTKAMITFSCDDGGNEDWRTIAPMLEERGFAGSFAVPPNLDGMYRQDVERMKNMESKGHEIVSHGYNHLNLTTLNEEQIEHELAESQKWLKNNDIKGHDIIVYPQGGNNALVRKLARKYYRAGIGTLPNNGINEYPLKMFDIARVSLGSYFQTTGGNNLDPRFPSDSSTYQYYKSRVDFAIKNGQWLIFMLHPDNASHDDIQNQHLSDLLDYIQNLDVDVVTYSQGLDILGNVADVGDYHYNDTEEYFSLSSTGEVRASSIEKPKPNDSPNLVYNHNFDIGNHLGFYSNNVANLAVSLETTEVKNGRHSLKLERLTDTNSHAIYQHFNYEKYIGKTLVFGAWVKCPHTNVGDYRLGVQDGVRFVLSDPIPNDSEWHWVTVKQTLNVDASAFQLNIGRVLSNAVVGDVLYVDSVYLYEDALKPTLDKKIELIRTDLSDTDNGREGELAYNVNSNKLFVGVDEDNWKSTLMLRQRDETVSLDFGTIPGGGVIDLEVVSGVDANCLITASPSNVLSVGNSLIWTTYYRSNRVYIRMANVSDTERVVPVGNWNVSILSRS